MMLLSVSLTGCATTSSAPKASLQIYQPRSLHLLAGQPVPTAEGLYRPQADETWHSAAAFDAVESALLNATAALSQLKNNP